MAPDAVPSEIDAEHASSLSNTRDRDMCPLVGAAPQMEHPVAFGLVLNYADFSGLGLPPSTRSDGSDGPPSTQHETVHVQLAGITSCVFRWLTSEHHRGLTTSHIALLIHPQLAVIPRHHPSLPGQMDCLSEGLLMAENYTCHEGSKELTKRGRAFAQHSATTTDWCM
jgi:hypothetical protein